MSMNITSRAPGGVTRTSMAGPDDVFTQQTENYEEDPLGDMASLRAAFRNPLYQTSASYRAMVAKAVSESMVTTASTHAVSRHQMTGSPVDQAPVDDRQLSAHDKAMIAKAEKHGIR